MHPPKVFISATSGDLRSIRQVVKEALLPIGCHPVEQTNFGPDWRTVGGMLRAKIEGCQALVHIAGMRYGAEPDTATLPAGTARRSYTQMEYHLGCQLHEERGDAGFRVYTFVCPEGFLYDPEPDAEAEETRALQRAHRTLLMDSPRLYQKPGTPDDIHTRILALQEGVFSLQQQLTEMKNEVRGARKSAHGVLAVVPMDNTAIEVFISSASEDYPSASEVFRHLSGLGIRCFFSEDTLDRLGQTQYKQVIESALEQCRHLILVTSSRANAEKKWVQHEWQTFDNECLSSRKEGNLITLACAGLTPAELPLVPRNRIVLHWPKEKDRLISYVGRKGTPAPMAALIAEDTPLPIATAPEPEAGLPEPVWQDITPAPSPPPDIPHMEKPDTYKPMANWSLAAYRMLIYVSVGGAMAMVVGYLWSERMESRAISILFGVIAVGTAIVLWRKLHKTIRLSQAAGQGGAQSPQIPPATKPTSLEIKMLGVGLVVMLAGIMMMVTADGQFLVPGILAEPVGLFFVWLAISTWWERWKGK